MRFFAIAGCVIANPPPASLLHDLLRAHPAAELFARRYNLAPGSEKALSPHLYLLHLLLVQCTYTILVFYVPCMIKNY